MEPEQTSTAADFDTAETFGMTMSFGKLMVRLLPLFVMLLVVGTMLFTLIGYLAGWGGTATWVVAACCSIPLSLLVMLVKRFQYKAQQAATRLTLSPDGLVMEEPFLTTRMSWDRVRRLGHTSMRDPLRVGGPLLGMILVYIGSIAARRRDSAAIGTGTFTVAKDAPEALRTQIEQNRRKLARDPKTGRQQYPIFLGLFDRDWKTGRIGDWVREYRPELLD